jgi:hypothetical protein
LIGLAASSLGFMLDPVRLVRVALLLQFCLSMFMALPALFSGEWLVGILFAASGIAFLAGRFVRGRSATPAWGAALLLLGLLSIARTGEIPALVVLIFATPAVALGWLSYRGSPGSSSPRGSRSGRSPTIE